MIVEEGWWHSGIRKEVSALCIVVSQWKVEMIHKAYIYCKLQHGVKRGQARVALSLFKSSQILRMEFSDKSLATGNIHGRSP